MEPEATQLLQDILAELRRKNNGGAVVREVMDVQQAAEYLGQSAYTVREWVRLRKIPHFKLNRSIRFRKSKIDRWMDLYEIPNR
jgi:excisionase family DNA binding protein